MEALDVCADLPNVTGKEMSLHSGVDPVGLLRHVNLEIRNQKGPITKQERKDLTMALTGVMGTEDMIKMVVKSGRGLERWIE